MTVMIDLTIAREILVEAPADVVWRTITEPAQMQQWFADRVELDLRPGGAGTLVFEEMGTKEPSVAALVVEVVDPPHRFAFRWSGPEGETPTEGNAVLVEMTIDDVGDGHTRVRVVESGLESIDWSDDAKAGYVEDHRHGWSVILPRLADRLTTTPG
jgi:uncharacterized protein YndB with AHSA1/START domain